MGNTFFLPIYYYLVSTIQNIMAQMLPVQRTPSFGGGQYSQTRKLLAPKTDTIDMEANPYDIGNRPLKHLDQDGVFYIRGVKYTMIPKEDGGYIGGGAYGTVWKAKRDEDAPEHDLRLGDRDIVAELLNASEICVKVFRVEKSKAGKRGVCTAQDARKEMQLHSRAGHYVHGVMAILAVTDIPAGTDVGPVTIDCKWSNQQPSKFDEDSHWVVMACEIARQGNLRRFISPLDRQGKTLLTQIEGEQRKGMDEQDAITHINRNVRSESVVASLQSEDVARGLMSRLLKQLLRLHHHGIVHLDLKPENITINEKWELCIIDFGLARPINDPTLSQKPMLGTLGFRPPEPYGSEKADVFSAGMILYCLITSAENPFFGSHPTRDPLNAVYKSFIATSYMHTDKSQGIFKCINQLQKWYKKGHPYCPRLMPSKKAASLVARMTATDKAQRPTIAECLEDPWFTDYDDIDDNEFRQLVIKSVAKTGDALDHWTKLIGSNTWDDVQQYRNTWVGDVETKLRGANLDGDNNSNDESKRRRMQ